MHKYLHDADELLPGILLDRDTQKFKLYGKSCPVNAFEFYEPVFNWLDSYIKDPLEQTTFDFFLNYINTASSKMVLKLMYKLEELIELGKNVKVRWFYSEDDDMMETGEEFEKILDLKFEFIETDNEDVLLED